MRQQTLVQVVAEHLTVRITRRVMLADQDIDIGHQTDRRYQHLTLKTTHSPIIYLKVAHTSTAGLQR